MHGFRWRVGPWTGFGNCGRDWDGLGLRLRVRVWWEGAARFDVVEIGLGDGYCTGVDYAAGALSGGLSWYGGSGSGVWIGSLFKLTSLRRSAVVSKASITFGGFLDG